MPVSVVWCQFVPVPVGISSRLHSQLMTDITVDVEFRSWIFLVMLCVPVVMEASVFPPTVFNSFIYVPSRMRLPMFCLNFSNLGCYLSLLLLFIQLHSLNFFESHFCFSYFAVAALLWINSSFFPSFGILFSITLITTPLYSFINIYRCYMLLKYVHII